jgi:pyridoxal phosphate enzyme (YggS family)
MTELVDVAVNLAKVNAAIAEAARGAGRDSAAVTLVAITKTHGPERIVLAIDAGQTVFGENRVQEAEAKWPALKRQYPAVRLHLVGPLQSNKCTRAVELFDVIETVDRPKLARSLARHMDESGHRPECFVQVNTGEEPQKAGVAPTDADAFIEMCRDELALPVTGLMCIPPHDEEPAPHFALLREIARRNGLERLSMGMSADFEIAVQFGATHVRVGTAIFGIRESYRVNAAP